MSAVDQRVRMIVWAILGLVCGVVPQGWAPECLAGERFALLVGVREYDPEELTSLQYTENDVTQLASVLMGSGYKRENVVLMTQAVGARRYRHLPTGPHIKKELNLLLKGIKEDDSIVVAFSGHGVQFQDEEDSWFCPADTLLADRNTLVSLSAIYDSLKNCKARSKLLLVDACRNDPSPKIAKSAKSIEVELSSVGGQPAAEPPGGVLAFFSCSRGEKAFEHQELEGGVFLHFLAEGLAGDADLNKDREIMLGELQEYTVRHVQSFVRTKLGKSQLPELRGEMRGLVSIAQVSGPAVFGAPVPAPVPAVALSPADKARRELGDTDKQLAAARKALQYYQQQVPKLDLEIQAKTKQLAELATKNAKLDEEIAYHREAINRGYYTKPKIRQVIAREREGIVKEINRLKAEQQTSETVQRELELAEGNKKAMQSSLQSTATRIQALERRQTELGERVGTIAR